jgi:hypothetical protein
MLSGKNLVMGQPALGLCFARIFISLKPPLYTGEIPVRLITL